MTSRIRYVLNLLEASKPFTKNQFIIFSEISDHTLPTAVNKNDLVVNLESPSNHKKENDWVDIITYNSTVQRILRLEGAVP